MNEKHYPWDGIVRPVMWQANQEEWGSNEAPSELTIALENEAAGEKESNFLSLSISGKWAIDSVEEIDALANTLKEIWKEVCE